MRVFLLPSNLRNDLIPTISVALVFFAGAETLTIPLCPMGLHLLQISRAC